MRHFFFNLTIPALALITMACSPAGADESKDSKEATARLEHQEEKPPEVTTTPVRKGDFARELESNGQLESHKKAEVPFRVQEQIASVVINEGDFVEKGEVIGSLHSFSYKKAVEKARNKYEQSVINLEDQLLGFGYELSDTSSAPQSVLKMARLRSGYNSASITLEEARHDLAQTTIRAPIKGVVSNLKARANNPSSAYEYFCQILDNTTLLVDFNLLETELEFVREGQSVEVFPYATPDSSIEGTVTSINPSVDEEGMVRVTARVPNKEQKLIDGMNARVLLKNHIPDCLIIPRQAVLDRQNRQVVFVYEDGKALWKYVETGYENSTHITVTDGLEEGMEVIVGNNLNLAHESEVVPSSGF